MPTRNALATARLTHAKLKGGRYHIEIQVWSHSYDHPDPARRSAMVSEVYAAGLGPSGGYSVTNIKITDRYGVDETGLWRRRDGANETGFGGYTEYDTGGNCGPSLPSVFWFSHTGIYDDRCPGDSACDAMRLQTWRATGTQIEVFNYLLGPVTFAFDLVTPKPPNSVRLVMSQIGGNGGNPAQRAAVLPNEEFTIVFP
jgi:hypothetical protein